MTAWTRTIEAADDIMTLGLAAVAFTVIIWWAIEVGETKDGGSGGEETYWDIRNTISTRKTRIPSRLAFGDTTDLYQCKWYSNRSRMIYGRNKSLETKEEEQNHSQRYTFQLGRTKYL